MIVIIITSSIVNVNAQSEEKKLIIEENIEHDGPLWYSVSCLKISCPGLALEIDNNGEIIYQENNHRLEWGGVLEKGATVSVFSDSDLANEDIEIDSIIVTNQSLVENIDLVDSVPSPGNQIDFQKIITEDHCFLGNCNVELRGKNRGIEFIGILGNNSDKDSIQIYGEPGDAIVISNIIGSEHIKMEIWKRNNSVKELIINNILDEENFFQYPKESELWIRVVSDSNEELYPYKFDIYRNNQSNEDGNSGELKVPWDNGEPLNYEISWYYESYITESDTNGDSIQFQIGENMKVSLDCLTSNENVDFELFLIDYLGVKENITMANGNCPEIIETNDDTYSIEVWVKSDTTSRWNISFSPLRSFDGELFSDAPETKWLDIPDERWSKVNLDLETSGSLHSGDNIDIFWIEITDINGSRIYLEEIVKTEVNYTIQEIDQETGVLVNTSNGEAIVLPNGNHTLRIERRASAEIEISYTFKLEYLGEYEEPEIGDYEDLSWMFNDFYIFIGILMLSPLMLVLFWNRKRIFYHNNISSEINFHDREKLIRIRERFSEQLSVKQKDIEMINSALIQLGESPWSSINEIWGEPELRHMTEQIEICAWKVSTEEKNILLGLKTFEQDWEISSIRFNYPEGSKLAIIDVTPNFISKGDEIFLDTLSKNSQLFISISLEGGPAKLALELSGLVENLPLAATPNKLIIWG